MHSHIDEFQQQIRNYFNEMITGVAFNTMAGLSAPGSDATVTITMAEGVTREPIPLVDLVQYTGAVIAGVTELYEVRVIAAWNDLLMKIFDTLVSGHFSGRSKLPALGVQKGAIDFSSDASLPEQFQKAMIKDFSFIKYQQRLATIGKLLKSDANMDAPLKKIRTHVELRNSFQHHNGVVSGEILKTLGTNEIVLLDGEGKPQTFKENARIQLFPPELDLLHKSLYQVTLNWRKSNADIPARTSANIPSREGCRAFGTN